MIIRGEKVVYMEFSEKLEGYNVRAEQQKGYIDNI